MICECGERLVCVSTKPTDDGKGRLRVYRCPACGTRYRSSEEVFEKITVVCEVNAAPKEKAPAAG